MNTETAQQVKNKRNMLHIEFLRAIAIYLVMFNHTKTRGFFLFSVEQDSLAYPFYLFLSIADKVAVPIFFMISGALLLGKEETIKELYQKRICKFLVVLITVSFAYQIYDWHYHGEKFDFIGCLKQMYTQKASVALWYLYAYLGILVMLPLLRRLAKGLTQQEYFYMLLCQIIIVGVIPISEYVLSKGTMQLCSNFKVVLLTNNSVFFFLMGYFVEHKLDSRYLTKKMCLLANLLGVVSIAISGWATYYRAKVMGECAENISQVFHNSLIVIPSIAIYMTAKYFFKEKEISEKKKKIILFFGGTSFGVFLLERMLRERTEFVFSFLEPHIMTLPACLLWILAAFLTGSIITALLKKVPIIKNYL